MSIRRPIYYMIYIREYPHKQKQARSDTQLKKFIDNIDWLLYKCVSIDWNKVTSLTILIEKEHIGFKQQFKYIFLKNYSSVVNSIRINLIKFQKKLIQKAKNIEKDLENDNEN